MVSNMSKVYAALSLSAGLLFSAPVHAWVLSENVSITEIMEWQDNGPIYFKLSNGVMCYAPATEKNLYSLILSMHVTGKILTVHCHDTSEAYGGIQGRRVHRILSTAAVTQ